MLTPLRRRSPERSTPPPRPGDWTRWTPLVPSWAAQAGAGRSRGHATLRSVLRPTATLLFTDCIRGEGPLSPEFRGYIERYEYCLHTVAEYAELLHARRLQDARDHQRLNSPSLNKREKRLLRARRAQAATLNTCQ